MNTGLAMDRKNRRLQTKINCLPDEIILKICSYLDVQTILRFAITCTRCANIVANSTAILKNIKLKLTKKCWQPTSTPRNAVYPSWQLLSLQRKYSTIEIVEAVASSHRVLSELFEKFGPHLRTLIITNSTLDEFTFLTILKCSSFLEELCISEVVIEKKLPAINPISIVNLTSVAIHHTNWLVFKFLIRSQITSLQINSYLDEGEGTRAHLIHMLSNQYRLRELTLHGTSSRTLFKDSDLNDIWSHQLSTFRIGCGFGKNSDAVDSNIINFLILNSETLRNVEITIPNCEQITAFALLNLSNVTSLTLDVGKLPKDQTLYGTLVDAEPNLQLTHLKLSGFFCQSAFVKILLNKYPAITNLELDDWSKTTAESDTLKFVSKKLPQLKKLFIPGIPSCSAGIVTLNALQQLSVSYIRNARNLINFIRKNSSIEFVKVGLVYVEQIACITDLMDLTQVQHWSFAGSAKILRMIFDLAHTNAPKTLKTVELCLLSIEHYSILKSTSRKTIKFYFPNNDAVRLRSNLDAFLK